VPVITEWDNDEKTIIRGTLKGDWNWDELDRANLDTIVSMMNSVNHRVDVLVDLCQAGELPPGQPLQKGYMYLCSFPANRGILVAVSQDLLYRLLLKAMKRIFPDIAHRLFVVSTIEDAYITIETTRQNDTAAHL
jgi:hypothetical protein